MAQMTSDLGIFLPGGKTGILLLHDLGGSALDMRSMAQGFARAGYSVCTPNLASQQDSTGWSSAAAIIEAEKATMRLKGQCTDVVVVGRGYGAMLAVEVARQNAGIVQALVLVEPRASIMPISGRVTAALVGLLPQTWLARLLACSQRAPWVAAQAPALSFAGDAGVVGSAPAGALAGLPAAALTDLARLLESAQAGLALVGQPSLLFHERTQRRGGSASSILLQRRLAGRVESIMMEDADRDDAPDRVVAGIVERSARFVATVLDENETKRGNQQRRQRTAAGRSSAA